MVVQGYKRLICLHGSYWGLSWSGDLESILPALESKVEVQLDIRFDIFPMRCNFTQFIYFLKTALHVLGGIFTHHQKHI